MLYAALKFIEWSFYTNRAYTAHVNGMFSNRKRHINQMEVLCLQPQNGTSGNRRIPALGNKSYVAHEGESGGI